MKPNSFEFYRPENLENALRLLHEKKDDAILLAGGQSLIPMMNMRLINSKSVIDLSALRELNGVTVKENKIRIGAMTRYVEIKNSEIVNTYIFCLFFLFVRLTI
jgi:carbon-monoxide dehydrogenase medium subunit/2-furoyl-CoA dehydrogenase FAD binding subunit